MEQQLEQVRDQQKESWNKFSSGWQKWDEPTIDFLEPMGKAIITYLNPGSKEVILDIVSGTGEPALSIAAIAKVGKVIMTDISEDMLAIARRNAARKAITNIETRVCDVCKLPFPDNSFDAISCRFGFMFFPAMQLAAKEMIRVVKPGGKISTSVWNVPEKNFRVTAIMGTIARNMDLPAPAPGAPSLFRCAQDGLITVILKAAGFKEVSQREVTCKLNCESPEVYWNMMNEVAAPIFAGLAKAAANTKEKIKLEMFRLIDQRFPKGEVRIDASALVISGIK